MKKRLVNYNNKSINSILNKVWWKIRSFDWFLFDILADDLNRLLTEERQRCDALANDNDSMFRLLEETRSQMLEIENNFKEKFQEDIKIIDQLNSQINYLKEEIQMKDKQIDIQVDNQFEIFED